MEREYHSHVTRSLEDSDMARSESDSPPQRVRKALVMSCDKRVSLKRDERDASAARLPPSPYRKSFVNLNPISP